jgi:hypothetical protein
MTPQQDIEDLISIVRDEAERREEQIKAQKRLFLFAIEIGRGRKLTPHQQSLYEKTFWTAHTLADVAKGSTPPSTFDKIAEEASGEWLDLESKVKLWLERALEHTVDEAELPPAMSDERRQMLAERLTELYGGALSAAEIAKVIDRIEHPLDRA